MTELIAAGSTKAEARTLPASADFLASRRSKAKECLVAELPEMRAVFGMIRIDERYGRPPAERLRVPIAIEESRRIWAAEVVLKEKAKVGCPGVPVYVKGAREADGTFHVLTLRPRPEGEPWDLLRTRRGTVMEISGYSGEAVCVGDCDREFVVPTSFFPTGTILRVGDTIECRGANPGTDREFVTFVARVLPGETGPSVRRVSGHLSDNPLADQPGEESYELRAR